MQTPIFVKTYDWLLWLLPHTAKFPKAQRHTVTNRLEAGAVAPELAGRGAGITGAGIGPADCLIATACRHASVALLTRNREHFERVSGLRLASLDA